MSWGEALARGIGILLSSERSPYATGGILERLNKRTQPPSCGYEEFGRRMTVLAKAMHE